jgi:hypothetical protein
VTRIAASNDPLVAGEGDIFGAEFMEESPDAGEVVEVLSAFRPNRLPRLAASGDGLVAGEGDVFGATFVEEKLNDGFWGATRPYLSSVGNITAKLIGVN